MIPRLILVLAVAASFNRAYGATPCPPPGLTLDGEAVTSTCVPTQSGGVRNGDLFSTDFSSGTASSIFSAAWGSKMPQVVEDSSSPSGRSLRFDWDSGFENYNGVFRTVSGNRKKLHVRILLKQGPGGTNGGIQKIIRFRPQINGQEAAAGTVNFQWGDILFFGDSYGDGQNHVQTSSASHGPNTFVGRWRYLEAMLDYSNPSIQHIAVWVDGTKVIDSKIPLRSPMPSTLNMNGVMILGTFNGPAADRMDYIAKVDISENYLGVP